MLETSDPKAVGASYGHFGYTDALCTSQIEPSTAPPPPSGNTQGIWRLFLPGREGIWSPLIGGGEFDR